MRTSTTRFSLCLRQRKSRGSVLAASSAGAAEPLLTSPGLAFPARVDGLRTSPGLPVAVDGLRRPTEACSVAPSIFAGLLNNSMN
jgi:hypothetical protein